MPVIVTLSLLKNEQKTSRSVKILEEFCFKYFDNLHLEKSIPGLIMMKSNLLLRIILKLNSDY